MASTKTGSSQRRVAGEGFVDGLWAGGGVEPHADEVLVGGLPADVAVGDGHTAGGGDRLGGGFKLGAIGGRVRGQAP